LPSSRLNARRAAREFSVLIAGGARDADTLAAQWAADRGIAAEIYTADWQGQGRKKW
jgi:hypothetical protein